MYLVSKHYSAASAPFALSMMNRAAFLRATEPANIATRPSFAIISQTSLGSAPKF